ncbi:hypothetical protein ACFW4K_25260 [Nocardiopsis alba]|uniref:hypothetical protein n=1 Tax=Nocardiopsis alba TaxID=53437 RepID=UPI00366C5E91
MERPPEAHKRISIRQLKIKISKIIQPHPSNICAIKIYNTEGNTLNQEPFEQQLQAHGIKITEEKGELLVLNFESNKGNGHDYPNRAHLPKRLIPQLREQLSGDYKEHPRLRGFISPSRGYVEIIVSFPRPGGFMAMRRMRDLEIVLSDCRHTENPLARITPEDADFASPLIHLSRPSKNLCIEISHASILACIASRIHEMKSDETWTPRAISVKIDFGKEIGEEELVTQADKLLYSLLFELDTRNRMVLSPLQRRDLRRVRTKTSRSPAEPLSFRFPKIEIGNEVGILFNFARTAAGNLPLEFLSYYQILEYFLPAAIRREALKEIRRELRDPRFEESNDESLLRLVSIAESAKHNSESNQFNTVIRQFTREDIIVDFLEAQDQEYFTKRGPISAEPLNLKNRSTNILDQVASRVYGIRNRIVHAKDDPRFGDAKVLLPQSHEANSLGPDVELVRLLAIEAMIANQGN